MKRTIDGRFIEKRVVIDNKLLKEIIYEIKVKHDLSWSQFGKKIGVGSQMIRHEWLIKNSTLPLSIFKKIEKLYGKKIDMKLKDPFWGQRLKDGKIKYKEVKLPDVNEVNFAEFYGILLGDGCVFSNLSGFSISGDKLLDKHYHEVYIKNLINYLFGTNPSFYYSKKQRSVSCFFYSKKVAEFLIKTGFPKGVKYKTNPVIPQFIFKNSNNLSACIRGIMDTDGSLSYHPHSKVMIHLSITSPSLRRSVLCGLEEIGIKGGEFNKGIMIYGKDKIKNFYEKIGFSNKKNQIKYEIFSKGGKIPSSKEVERFLR